MNGIQTNFKVSTVRIFLFGILTLFFAQFGFADFLITSQPQSQEVQRNGTVQFSVNVEYYEPVFFQWYFNSTRLPNQTSSQLTLTNVSGINEGNYWVLVYDWEYAIQSRMASLSIPRSPTILGDLADRTVTNGMPVTLSFQVDASKPLLSQWFFNGDPIPGANNPTLSFL